MKKVNEIKKGGLNGELTLPPSKSHTLRALFFALMASGESKIENPLFSSDATSMINAIEALGAIVKKVQSGVLIKGVDKKLKTPSDVIDCGNSGITLRFITAISSLLSSYTIITGDHSIRHQRPMESLLNSLQSLGAFAVSSKLDGHAPIIIKGPAFSSLCSVDGEDSQLVSALLILGAFLEKGIEIEVKNPKELPWIDMTLFWLRKFSINVINNNYTFYQVFPIESISGFVYKVPSDWSQAAFFIAAAAITQSNLSLIGLDLDDAQGDKIVLEIFKKMGVDFDYDKKNLKLTLKPPVALKAVEVDMDQCIDALPILAVIGSQAKGATRLYNAAICRKKESNRLEVIASELKKMGAKIEVSFDELMIHQSPLFFAEVDSHHDHRIAMALSIAGLVSKGGVMIHHPECVKKTYPLFFDDLQGLISK